jgi:hypothetical protein
MFMLVLAVVLAVPSVSPASPFGRSISMAPVGATVTIMVAMPPAVSLSCVLVIGIIHSAPFGFSSIRVSLVVSMSTAARGLFSAQRSQPRI